MGKLYLFIWCSAHHKKYIFIFLRFIMREQEEVTGVRLPYWDIIIMTLLFWYARRQRKSSVCIQLMLRTLHRHEALYSVHFLGPLDNDWFGSINNQC